MPRRPMAGRASISGVALVLALVASLLGSGPARAAGGTLAGTLTGPDGARFEYFRVDLYQADGPDAWQLALTRTITSWDTGLPVGDFAIAVPAGSYRACFTPLTFESDEVAGRGCWQGAFDVFGATDIGVAEGGTTTIAPRLPRESRLRGRILGPGGIGISAYVQPYRKAPDGTWERVVGGQQSLSDGTFTLTDVDPGTYRYCLLDVPREFIAECWEDEATLDLADEVAVAPGSTVAIYPRLARRALISGTVTLPAGSAESAGVSAYRWRHERWDPVAYSAIGGEGRYRITGLDADTYRLCAFGFDIVATCWQQGSHPDDATDIVLATGEARTGVDLAPGRAGYVEGTLPDVYLGAEGWPFVTAYRLVGDRWQGVSSGEAVPVGTGSDWTYQIGSLPAGTYVACVHHEQPELGIRQFPTTCTGNSPTPQGGVPFEVVAGQTTSGIDIETGQAGEIRGRVEGTTKAVRIDLHLPSGRLALSRMTDAEGFYRLRDLPAGSYRVGFHRETTSSSQAAEWWQNKGDGVGPTDATPVTVPEGTIVPGIRAVLDAGGTITGRLLDASGDPVGGCQVQARARDGSLAVRRAVSDAAGAFAIGGLSTASYVVLVTKACSGGQTGLYYDADSPAGTSTLLRDADAVAVQRGATTTLAVDLHTATP